MRVTFGRWVVEKTYYYKSYDLLKFMNEHYPRKTPWTDEQKAMECLNRWASGNFIQEMFSDVNEMNTGRELYEVDDLEIEFR